MADKRPPGALPPLHGNQAAASAPDAHVWLSASAGTGKTQVLAARVFRLLLRGVAPDAILALTFTKAGAAEMAHRINERLARWVRMPEHELFHDLDALGEASGRDPSLYARARKLFASVLESPGGGVRIQTIHGFCQSLLAAFPVEAGLIPGFRLLEGREEAVLARETLAEMLVTAEREGRSDPVAATGALSLRMGEGEAERFLTACAHAGPAMTALPPADGLKALLWRALDLPPGDIDATITERCGTHLPASDLEVLREANRGWDAKQGQGHADLLDRWLAADAHERPALLEELRGVGFTKTGTPRKHSAKLLAHDPDYAERAERIGGVCGELLGLAVRARYGELLAAALAVGRDYAATYARAKRRLGAVDYDDLIRATIALLDTPGMGEWVRYKLDRTTDHILVDEAQDTNPEQWRIVNAIAGEFFAGEGRPAPHGRTLFTVGDYKQAIFGFQGTDPIYFAAAEKHFTRMADAAIEAAEDERNPARRVALPMQRLSLTHSFRSTQPVLEFVDAAVERLPGNGMGEMAPHEVHNSRIPGPGSVTLWPPVVAGDDPDAPERWIDEPVRALAARIARQIRRWVGTLRLETKGRTLRPEDVMILVKRRGELASLIVARLYAEGVPVAGVDRLRLNAPLAVQDLLAAVRFVLQPGDDLSLASLLVSPLIGWGQDRLMAAAPRGGGSLWGQLLRTQGDESLGPLRAMLDRADFETPYRFLEQLLTGLGGGRRAMLRRLGQEARDPIEELLSAALQFENLGNPSLQRFLDWFDRGEVEIKRDPSAPLDAVRVMTAHGAKGLQAPLVILADACVDPTMTPRSTLQWEMPGLDGGKVPIFRPKKEEASGPLAELADKAQAKELEEHWRLFYVAATRAEERLVIAGSLGARAAAAGEPPALSWYAAAATAMTGLGVEADASGERVFTGTKATLPAEPSGASAKAETEAQPLPDWVTRPAPIEARPPRPLAPSSIGDDAVSDSPPSAAMRAAAERGRLIHALFERLPAVAPEERRAAAGRWLARQGSGPDEQAAIARMVCQVIGDPAHAALFGADSLAEAPITATLPNGLVIAGTVDRLVVTDDAVRLVDFKTGRQVPGDLGGIPSYHLRQMAAYAAALGVIFPGKRVEAALLYTAGPTLYDLPADLLDRHKPGFVGAQDSLAGAA